MLELIWLERLLTISQIITRTVAANPARMVGNDRRLDGRCAYFLAFPDVAEADDRMPANAHT